MARRGLRSSWIPAVGAALVILVVLGLYQVDVLSLVKFSAYLVVLAFPGIFVWRLLLRHLHTDDGGPTWFEDVALGSIFGFGLQLPLYLLGVAVGLPLIYLALPVAIVGLTVFPWGRRVWTMPTAKTDPRLAWGVAIVALYAVATLAHSTKFAGHTVGSPPSTTLGVDGTFHLALITELMHHFPPQVPYFMGHSLDYQWFLHAQVAANHWLTGIDPSLMLQRIMPVASLALTVSGLAAVALRLTGRLVAAVLAPAILVVGCYSLMGPFYDEGQFTEAYLSRRFVSSPTEAYGFMMALPAIMLILEVLRPDRRAKRVEWLALALALLALSGSKATFIPVFVCGALGLWVFRLVERRKIDKEVTALAGLLIAVAAFAQLVLFRGNSGGLAVAPMQSVAKALELSGIDPTVVTMTVMTLTMLLGWLLYGVGVIGLYRQRRWRDTRALWMIISVPAGIAVPFVLFRSGGSQYWFQRSVAELIVLLSVWGLVQLLPNPLPKRLAVRLSLVAAAAGAVAFVISMTLATKRSTASYRELLATAVVPILVVAGYLLWRRLANSRRPGSAPPLVCLVVVLLGLPLSHAYTFVYETATRQIDLGNVGSEFARGATGAGLWIQNHSHIDAVVATNVHCRKPLQYPCDNRSFWVAALTQRRVVVEGWGYMDETNQNFTLGESNALIGVPDRKRLAINDAAFLRPSVRTVSRLVDTYGVRFLFVSKLYPANIPGLEALPGLLKKTLENDNYVIFRVLKPDQHGR